MKVYQITYFPGREGPAFIAADNLGQAFAAASDWASGVEMLGELAFAEGAKASAGGRQVTLDEAKASITDSHLVSFEDGRPYKSLTRHLKAHGLTFDQYKAKWGLPEQYPSVHPSYTIMRRDMALAAGLGRGKKGAGKK